MLRILLVLVNCLLWYTRRGAQTVCRFSVSVLLPMTREAPAVYSFGLCAPTRNISKTYRIIQYNVLSMNRVGVKFDNTPELTCSKYARNRRKYLIA